MLTQHVALVPEAEAADASEMARVCAALQRQVMRDLAPIWGISASVDLFLRLEDVPIGYWPIILTTSKLGSLAGVHVDNSGQPYARVELSGSWSHAASRACLEMLVNPFESRTIVARSPRAEQDQVNVMLEICGPCEGVGAGYCIDDVLVSDFCTPAFYAEAGPRAERYSWNGTLTGPLQEMRGGHLTWFDPISGSHWLRSHWGDAPVDTRLGDIDRRVTSVRELVQACAPIRSDRSSLVRPLQSGREPGADAPQLRVSSARRLLSEGAADDFEAAFAATFLQREGHETEARPRSRRTLTLRGFNVPGGVQVPGGVYVDTTRPFRAPAQPPPAAVRVQRIQPVAVIPVASPAVANPQRASAPPALASAPPAPAPSAPPEQRATPVPPPLAPRSAAPRPAPPALPAASRAVATMPSMAPVKVPGAASARARQSAWGPPVAGVVMAAIVILAFILNGQVWMAEAARSHATDAPARSQSGQLPAATPPVVLAPETAVAEAPRVAESPAIAPQPVANAQPQSATVGERKPAPRPARPAGSSEPTTAAARSTPAGSSIERLIEERR